MAALWIIALLSTLVVGTATLLLQDVEMEGTRRQIFRARSLAEMGLAVAMHPAVLPNDPILHQQFGEDEFVDVEIIGEDGRLNMNVLLQREDRDTLFRIFGYWGLDPQQSGSLFDALLDWVDGDDFVRIRGAESRQYGRVGMPFNRPFRSVEEIALVQGMAEIDAVYPQWRNWFSVYASGVLDLNEAEPQLISAVTGADILRAQELRARRLGEDGIANTDDDAPMPDVLTALSLLGLPISNPAELAAVVSVTSQTRRIIARAQAGDRTREVAIVTRGAPGQAGGVSQILWMGER
jgi:type II secretory pathway component PulK